MADNIQQQNDKRTVVAFIVGLLIGGLLVWAFSGPAADAPENTERNNDDTEEVENTPADNDDEDEDNNNDEAQPADEAKTTLPVGDGEVSVTDTTAGTRIPLASATFPVSEGWVGVREYTDENLGGLLGVSRFSEAQGLVPTEIVLLRPTKAGTQYAVVMYTESGDRTFSLADDVQIDTVYETFTAK
jgi:hypothetical protein